MGFFAFFFLFVFVVVIGVVASLLSAFFRLKRKVAGAFRGDAQGESSKQPEEPARRKVYDDGVGDYVKIEEIIEEEEVPHEKVEFRRESQVSDVEFEEIRD